MTELQREGKIIRWGMSNLDVPDMERILALLTEQTAPPTKYSII